MTKYTVLKVYGRTANGQLMYHEDGGYWDERLAEKWFEKYVEMFGTICVDVLVETYVDCQLLGKAVYHNNNL